MKLHDDIILYKPQGKLQLDTCKYLTERDFILVLQTPLQADLMKKLGNDKVICVDSTHGTKLMNMILT